MTPTLPAGLETLPDLVQWCGERYGDRPALTRPGEPDAKAMTFRQLAETVRGVAARLAETVDGPRARVALLGRAGPDWLAALLATGRAGMVCVPVPPDTPLEVMPGMMDHVDARVLIADDRAVRGEERLAGRPVLRVSDLLHRPPASPSAPRSSPHDVALFVLTSGSTERPRAVALTHGNLMWNIRALLRRERATGGDVFLSLLPPAHLFELVVGQLGPLACGSSIVYGGSLLPNRILAALRSHRITRALVVPALLDALYREAVDRLVEDHAIGPTTQDQSLTTIAKHLETSATGEQIKALRGAVRERIGSTFRMLVVGGGCRRSGLVRPVRGDGSRARRGVRADRGRPGGRPGSGAVVPVRFGRPAAARRRRSDRRSGRDHRAQPRGDAGVRR